jgi:[acyl-carrier-protein] S-malonyltransferase
MNSLALLFSGQGAQFVGMGKELFESSPAAKAVFQKADEALGVPLSKVCFEGPEEKLTETTWCQPAIFTHSLAALAAVKNSRPNLSFQATAGLSLGEFTALTAANWLSFEDGIRIVRKRGALMQQACDDSNGSMASIMGMEAEPLRAVCKETGVDLANLNCPGQIVISGDKACIEKAIALAKERGAKRAIPLTVAGAYHSRLMKPAAEQLSSALASVTFKPSSISVISNVTAQPHEANGVKSKLVEQVTSSVRWEDSMKYLVGQGFRKFIELGPGEVLAGLMKRIDRDAQIISINKPADLDKLANFI